MHKITIYCTHEKVKKPIHFCFITDQAYQDFKEKFPDNSINEFLRKWFEREFSEKADFKSLQGVEKAKHRIISAFEEEYPFLATQGTIDRHGALRWWVQKHLYREVFWHDK